MSGKNKFAHTCGEMSAGFINITIKDLHTKICLLYTGIDVFPWRQKRVKTDGMFRNMREQKQYQVCWLKNSLYSGMVNEDSLKTKWQSPKC